MKKNKIKAITISCQNLLHNLLRTVAISYNSIVLQDVQSFLWPAFVHTCKILPFRQPYPSFFLQLFYVRLSPPICTFILYNDFTPVFAYFPNAGTNEFKKLSIFTVLQSSTEAITVKLRF